MVPLAAHHVGIGLSRHALGGVLVEELVDAGRSQSVPDLQVTEEKGDSRRLGTLSGERLVLESELCWTELCDLYG